MGTFRTCPPPHYLAPTREEMREMTENVGLKRFSPSLLSDLANIRAGGEIYPPSHWRDTVERQTEEAVGFKATPGGGGKGAWWKKADGNWIEDRKVAVQSHVDRITKYHSAVCDFVRTVEWDGVPGNTPLEQATRLLKLLAAKAGEPGGDGETLPIFQEQAGDSVARELAEVLDEVEDLDKEDRELLDPDDKQNQSAGSGSGSKLQAMRIAEELLHDAAKREMVRIARSLEDLSRMRVARQVKFEPDPEGDDVRSRPIKNLGELTRVAKPAWAKYQRSRTLFWYEAISGQLPVRERGIRRERKQLLYLIIDCSGSMKEGLKIAKACGVLMNRLKAVMRGDAVLYWRLFDTKLYAEHFVSTAAEAKAAMDELRRGNFSGGGTKIDSCARESLARIEEIMAGGETHRPELVVVTDGCDTVRLQASDIHPTRLHAFVVSGGNPDLINLAVKSGGVGITEI